MPKRKMELAPEMWLTANEAAAVLTANTDHSVDSDYVRWLARGEKITWRAKNGREKEYLKDSVETYRVRPQGTPRVRPRPRKRGKNRGPSPSGLSTSSPAFVDKPPGEVT